MATFAADSFPVVSKKKQVARQRAMCEWELGTSELLLLSCNVTKPLTIFISLVTQKKVINS